MAVYIGNVETFPNVEPNKAQALKVLEESAEVFGAWQIWNDDNSSHFERMAIVEECADVIQAVCNLLAGLGVRDMRDAMERCEERNVKRGRM